MEEKKRYTAEEALNLQSTAYQQGYNEGYELCKQERPGAVWVKASAFKIEYGPNYYAKWLDGKVKATGHFQESDGTFFWNVPGYIPIGKNEYEHLYILDESSNFCNGSNKQVKK